ncbi:hypothetical protein CSA37_05385 [Candidatus Fermentibacteria bacterium]|nr:MAG: hypothetical protein CSA37_05385 [Candidatus Fermentibacteria bacterium]
MEDRYLRVSFVMLGLKDYSTGGYILNHQMVDALRAAGHQVDVIHYRTIPSGCRGSRLKGSFHVLRRVLAEKPDLLVVSKSYSFMIPLRLALYVLDIPLLYMVHHLEWHDRSGEASGFRKGMVKWFLGRADRIWVNSRCTASDVVSLGISPDILEVVPPGLDDFPVKPYSERELPLRIISVGTVCPRKDQLTLVRACGIIRELDFVLEILGDESADPDYSAAVREAAEAAGIWNKTIFSGHVSRGDLEKKYSDSHVLANLSRWEGYGMAAAEALRAGIPVVAADAGAVPELVTSGENGFLVEPGNAAETASRLQELLTDEELRKRMADDALRKGRGLNTWKASKAALVRLSVETAFGKVR